MLTDAFGKRAAPIVLRLGLAGLFLWFGVSQLMNPADWVSWVPTWAPALIHGSSRTVVLLNGGFETIGGILLLIGILVRPVAFLLGLHILAIAYMIGYDPIAIRDACIGIAAFALACFGADEWSLGT